MGLSTEVDEWTLAWPAWDCIECTGDAACATQWEGRNCSSPKPGEARRTLDNSRLLTSFLNIYDHTTSFMSHYSPPGLQGSTPIGNDVGTARPHGIDGAEVGPTVGRSDGRTVGRSDQPTTRYRPPDRPSICPPALMLPASLLRLLAARSACSCRRAPGTYCWRSSTPPETPRHWRTGTR